MIDLISRQKVIEALTEKVKQLRDMAEGIETWDGTLIGSRIAGIEHAIMFIETEPPVDAIQKDIFRKIRDEIEKTPSADIVEVVRCKDCKHSEGVKCSMYYTYAFNDEDYCSMGERKEE